MRLVLEMSNRIRSPARVQHEDDESLSNWSWLKIVSVFPQNEENRKCSVASAAQFLETLQNSMVTVQY